MWGRVIEIMLALWLMLSPWIFGHYGHRDPGAEIRALWLSDLISAGLVVAISLLSLWPPLRRLHLLNIVVAVWLVGYAYFAGGYPNEPGHKNEILVGLTLLLIAIIPNEANDPPVSWRRFYEARAQSGAQRR